MKRVYSKVTMAIAGGVRWTIAAIISAIIAVPTVVAFTSST